MLTGLNEALGGAEKALLLRAQRQQVIASNIANADTPNYRAADMDFAAALQRARGEASGGAPVVTPAGTLARTQTGHLAASQPPPLPSPGRPGLITESASAERGADGNTVDIDVEHARFAENAVRYEAAFRVLNGKIRALLSAIQG